MGLDFADTQQKGKDLSDYRVLLFRCPRCGRPIPVINSSNGPSLPLPVEELEIACLERLVCKWKDSVRLSLAEQTLLVHWTDKRDLAVDA
jgi:hypothetical protein